MYKKAHDRARCRRAGIPDDRAFATKPALARQMLERTMGAGVHLAWVTGDCVYGNDRALRQWLETRAQAYLLAVNGHESVWWNHQQTPIKVLLANLPADGWERISAGRGSKGSRWDEWLRLEVSDPPQTGWKRWVVVRRSVADPTTATAYLAYAPTPTTVAALVRVAGMRWTIEESFQTAKGTVGLDHYEVRSWTGWYRHITLVMWAQALLAVIRAETGSETLGKKALIRRPAPTSLATVKRQLDLPAILHHGRILLRVVVVASAGSSRASAPTTLNGGRCLSTIVPYSAWLTPSGWQEWWLRPSCCRLARTGCERSAEVEALLVRPLNPPPRPPQA